MNKLVFMSVFLILSLAMSVNLSGQSMGKKGSKTVNVDVILVPSPPGVPIPYPNIGIKYQSGASQSASITRGQALTFELSGDNLEYIKKVEVYLGNSKTSAFAAKLESIPRGARRVQHRKVFLTPKNLSSESTTYKINFRKDRKSGTLYQRAFLSKSSR
jgi:hypothetical protein